LQSFNFVGLAKRATLLWLWGLADESDFIRFGDDGAGGHYGGCGRLGVVAVPRTMLVPAFSWTSFYVGGGNVGGATTSVNELCSQHPAFLSFWAAPLRHSFVGGLQAGYDRQFAATGSLAGIITMWGRKAMALFSRMV
jgi:hypothetical protein